MKKPRLPSLRRHPSPATAWDGFEALQREVDRVFSDFGQVSSWFQRGRDDFDPTIDISETDNDLQVTAELPGVDDKDVEVTLVGNTLTIKGEKHAEKDREEKDYHVVERSFGSFQRILPLGFEADPDAVDAKFAKGALTVIVPKPAEQVRKTKKITVQGS